MVVLNPDWIRFVCVRVFVSKGHSTASSSYWVPAGFYLRFKINVLSAIMLPHFLRASVCFGPGMPAATNAFLLISFVCSE